MMMLLMKRKMMIIKIMYLLGQRVDFHEFHMEFLEDKEKLLILRNLISDKEIVFEAILSAFKEVKPEFKLSFNEYEDYKQVLRYDYECSDECLEFYQCFLAFENTYPNDFKKSYQYAAITFKLKKKNNEPSISNFKLYLEMFQNKNWVEEKGDEVVIGDISISN